MTDVAVNGLQITIKYSLALNLIKLITLDKHLLLLFIQVKLVYIEGFELILDSNEPFSK